MPIGPGEGSTTGYVRKPRKPQPVRTSHSTAAHAAVGQQGFIGPSIVTFGDAADSPVNTNSYRPPARTAPIAPPVIHRPFLRGLQGMVYPVRGMDPSAFTSSYGPRINPVTHRPSFHTGMDIAYPMGTPVYAVDNGIVDQANFNDSIYGNQVVLNHGHDKETMYGHMEKFVVEPGQKVHKGDIIGYIGSTGMSTGPHLHFETWNQGNPLNPMTFLGGVGDDNNGAYNQQPHQQMPAGPSYAAPSESSPGHYTYYGNQPPVANNGGGLAEATIVKYTAPGPGSVGHYTTQAPVGPVQPGGPISQRAHFSDPLPDSPNGELGAFLQAISSQESNGNYSAVGVPTAYGTALGKYQVLDANLMGPDGWDIAALGRDISPQQYLNNPRLQEIIARYKLSEYFKQYGAAGAAKAWYAGPGNADSMSTAPQYGGPSIVQYSTDVMNRMQQYLK